MNGFEYCRLRAGLTQEAVSHELNVAQGTVCNWETGRVFPRKDKIPELARLYKCSIDDLFAGTENQRTQRQLQKKREMREFARKYGLGE